MKIICKYIIIYLRWIFPSHLWLPERESNSTHSQCQNVPKDSRDPRVLLHEASCSQPLAMGLPWISHLDRPNLCMAATHQFCRFMALKRQQSVGLEPKSVGLKKWLYMPKWLQINGISPRNFSPCIPCMRDPFVPANCWMWGQVANCAQLITHSSMICHSKLCFQGWSEKAVQPSRW